jgi:putative ABC transport system ATP-binding protein
MPTHACALYPRLLYGAGAATTREAALSTPATAPTYEQAADVPLAARARALTKAYGTGETTVRALDAVDVDIARGRFTAVMGPSGSGKSTFLHMAAGLDRPTAGMVRLGGVALDGMSETKLTELRRERVGFVFQAFNLLPALTVAQNIDLPLRLSRGRADRSWRREVVDRVGLGDRLRHRPAELSGGQQQRARSPARW